MKHDLKFEGSKVIATVELDPNGDGQPLAKVTVEIDLAEAPDEVMSAVMKKKDEKKA